MKKIVLVFIVLAPLAMIAAVAGHGTADLPSSPAPEVSTLNAGSTDDEINEACRDCYSRAASTCAGKSAWDTFWCTLWEQLKCVFTSCAHTYPITSGP